MSLSFHSLLRIGTGLLLAGMLVLGCKESGDENNPPTQKTRSETIPSDVVKGTPATDQFPPVLHSNEWDDPVPMAGPVNTAGAEDAPVITPDGQTFCFFFTPDIRIPPERQLIDGVSGIWWSKLVSGEWTEPERMVLCEDVALDGPMCIESDTLWFASFRVGNYRTDGDIYLCENRGCHWENWQNAGELLNGTYNIGEMYTSADGLTLIFDRTGTDGFGGVDLWQTEFTNGSWSVPENLGAAVNTALDETRPFLSSEGTELWFTSTSRLGYTGPALFRSVKTDSVWGAPQEIISNFAGDPALDAAGNIYFTHHFFINSGAIIEADVYMSRKR
ncbi:hypothetical protein EHM69_10420 [candidate division KSB1 bacterium]|nr:MAG: hypothetical protein EHM69_10420 [candidate division KSB1 bacterium]